MRLYAITDRRLFPGSERERCAALLLQAERWVAAGVEIIQLREKDLSGPAVEDLAGRLVELAQRSASSARSRVLVNAGSAGAVAFARQVGADGVHLPGHALVAAGEQVRREELALVRESWAAADLPLVSVACHSAEEVVTASVAGASLILFAPVFEKPIACGVLPGVGLDRLRAACVAAGKVPVFALGGVSVANAAECVAAGAVGVAGIRLFAGDAWRGLVGR